MQTDKNECQRVKNLPGAVSSTHESTIQQLSEILHYRRIAASFDVSPETMAAFDAAVERNAESVKLRIMHFWSQISREEVTQ